MNSIKTLLLKRSVRHILFWSFWCVYIILTIESVTGSYAQAFQLGFTILVIVMIPNYIHFFLLEHFLFKLRLHTYWISFCILLITYSAGFHWFATGNWDYQNSFFQTFITGIIVLLIPASMKFFRRTFLQEIQLHEAWEKQKESELKVLKNQVSPHFLFNTLNNLYALSLNRAERVPNMILKLAGLMRYLLESSTRKTALLSQECSFIENYVALEQLRQKQPEHISIHIEGDVTGKQIAPMVLIPFIENAFKHGINLMMKDIFLDIELKINGSDLILTVENSKPITAHTHEDSVSHTGLRNVKRRLQILYPDKHLLTIQDSKNRYKVSLELSLC